MFPRRYFGNRFYPGRYFGHAGAAAPVGGGSFGGKFMIYDEDDEGWYL